MTKELFDIFRGFVGLSFLASGESGSGLYADQLPDVSERDIEKIRKDEDTSADTFEEIEGIAIRRLYIHFAKAVRNEHKVKDSSDIECLMQVCKEALAFPLQYAIGAEIMHRRATSSRINTYTSLDGRDKAKEMEEQFAQRMEDELEDVILNLDIHNSGCFECANQPQPNEIVSFSMPII